METAIKHALLRRQEDVLFVTKSKEENRKLQRARLCYTSYLPFVRGYYRRYYYVNVSLKKHFLEICPYLDTIEVRYYET